jgi:hypothetical protein
MARATYYHGVYIVAIPVDRRAPMYSERVGRSEGVVQAPDRRQVPPPGPPPAVEGASKS